MPARFGLTYVGADNAEHMPVVIHRALLGSLERFIGILLEHTAGDLPFWLAPVQVRLIPVAERHREALRSVENVLRDEGYRVDVDDRDETVGRRIRDAELQKVPRVVVWGDKESRAAIAVRARHGEQKTLTLAQLLDELATI
jgi:threonyl-tRNA synthetase